MLVSGLLSRLRCTCLAGFLALGTAPAHAQNQPANLVPDHAGFTQRTVLPGHRPAWAIAAADRGTLPDAQNVQLTFSLARSPQVQAAFDQLLADQQNPSSPRFHQWLTPQQAGAQFGPTQHDLDALTTWLTGQGFTVDAVTPSRIFVQVSAPAAIVEAALGTSLHTWQVAHGSVTETMQAPAAEPTLPSALASLVSFIGGLTSVPVHTHSHLQAHTASVTSTPGALHPNLTVGSATNPVHFLTPLDFDKVYDVPASVTGAGQRVMIVGGSRLSPSDVSYFESSTALPSYVPNIIVDPAYADPGQTNDGNQGEATLDFNRVFGTAPGAQVDLVIAQNWLNGTVSQNLILYAINTVNDPVLSLSFGACENLQPTGYVKQEDAMYSQAAAQGITTLVSSGDAGVTGCAVHNAAPTASTAYPNINDICASSYVTCVGGTQFNDTANADSYWSPSNGTGFSSVYSYIPEGAWNEPVNTASNAATVPYVLAATGGGPSTIIAKPVWQTGTGVPADGMRDTPDVSFAAASHDGYFSCLASAGTAAQDTGCVPVAVPGGYSFGFVAFSGTSAAAPSMAGVVALLDQKLGGRQGNINPTLYKLAASTPAVFHDATIASSGVLTCAAATPNTCNNSSPSSYALTGGVPGYVLQTGYDLATGLGSLDVNAFLTAASAPTLLATTQSLTATPATITTAQTVVFKDIINSQSSTVPTGSVTFTLNSTGANLGTITLVNGAASTAATAFPTSGTYLVNAAYSGDSTFAASTASVSLVVTALPATTTTLTGTTGTITAQTGATYTAIVAAATASTLAPTGNVQFLRTSTVTGQSTILAVSSVVAGKASVPPTFLPAGTYTITAVYLGDTNFASSTSNPLAITSTAIPTTITLLYLTPVTTTTLQSYRAMVVSSTATGVPTGTVQFTLDGNSLTPADPLVSGNALTPTLALPGGTHTLCAAYSGDSTFAASQSTCQTLNVAITQTAITLSPATMAIASYQTTPLTATLTGFSPMIATNATVSFRDGATLLATVNPVPVVNPNSSSYTAIYNAGPLSVGTHTVTATFNGDSTYAPATSNTSTVTVTLASVTLTPASTALTTPAGISASDVISLTSLNFAGTENLTCTVALSGSGPAANPPGCSLSPATATFNGSGTATSTLTLTSIKPSARTGGDFSSNRTTTLRGLSGLTLCALFALCLPRRARKSMQSLRMLAVAALLTLALAATAGCGSKNNFVSGTPPVAGTTSGQYTITITAAGSSNVSASTTVALTIQ